MNQPKKSDNQDRIKPIKETAESFEVNSTPPSEQNQSSPSNNHPDTCDQNPQESEPSTLGLSPPPYCNDQPDCCLQSCSDVQSLVREFGDFQKICQFLRFNSTFEEVVDKESSSARSLFPFIRAKLNQFGLGQQYDEVAILQEVYLRTICKILEGREITNHYAWIRSVAFRYIRELSRKDRRNLRLDYPSAEGITAPGNTIDTVFLSDEAQKMRQAFKKLSPEEQLLLSLKAVQDLSWQEIKNVWVQQGYKPLELPALRKRKERALSRLRQVYHTL